VLVIFSENCELFEQSRLLEAGFDLTQVRSTSVLACVRCACDTCHGLCATATPLHQGWHGYKPDQKHKIDINADNIKMTDEQV
jgi:hypothetical protein